MDPPSPDAPTSANEDAVTTPSSVENANSSADDTNKSNNSVADANDANITNTNESDTNDSGDANSPPSEIEDASISSGGNAEEETIVTAPSTSAQQMESSPSSPERVDPAPLTVDTGKIEPESSPAAAVSMSIVSPSSTAASTTVRSPQPQRLPSVLSPGSKMPSPQPPRTQQSHVQSPHHAPHAMQFPYASSNFMAPMPTPIRPLAGDPRLQTATASDGSLVQPQQPHGGQQAAYASGGGAAVSASNRMYQGPQASDVLKNDPSTASFESQWNQSVPTPTTATTDASMGWAPATATSNTSSGMMTMAPPVPQQQQAMAVVDGTQLPSNTMGSSSSMNGSVAPPPPLVSVADPVLTSTPFSSRSLVPQRVDDNTFALDPMNLANLIAYGKSLTTPSHAAAFAVDLLRASVQNEHELGAHGWLSQYQANEYEVLLHKGSIGLCMNMSVRAGCVTVTSFRRPECGVIGPAEACGMIETGDDLVGVDGYPIQTPDDFQLVVGRLKSIKPVLLRFRRQVGSLVPLAPVKADPHGYKRGLRTSTVSLDNSEFFTSGIWHLGVRYLAPGQWAAELHGDGGGIRRLGVFATEREAAILYNRYIHQTYGPTAGQHMNPAGMGMGAGAGAGGSGGDGQQGVALPVSVSTVRDMKPLQRPQPPVRRTSVKAAFTNEQKEQLRAQIMVFKYVSTGTAIANEWLQRAVKSAAPLPTQEGHDKRKKRKTFSSQAVVKPIKKKAKRGAGAKKKKGKRGQYSDESEELSGGSEDDDGRAAAAQAAAQAREAAAPTRRSGRNAGKTTKSYVVKENASDFEDSDDSKPKPVVEEPKVPKGPQMDKIIGVRFHKEATAAGTEEENDEDDNEDVTMQFLIKWKDVSYVHLSWLSTHDMEEFGHSSVMRMRRYLQKNSRDVEQARENVVIGEERDFSAYFSESFLEVDRILAVKEVEELEEVNPYVVHINNKKNKKLKPQKDGEAPPVEPVLKRGKKYLIKWRDLSYVDCSWEWEEEITDDRKIAAFHRYNHPPIINGAHPAMFEDVRPEPSSWAKYSESPSYNNQNTLRSYQLEGLNWLVFCWYNRRNCILADEMGLGKTVQATSILEHLRQHEHVRGPFLVIAPLATLGNWKREIETWTTMNCVVYHDSEGGADIRAFIRDHEFYYGNDMYKKRGVYKFNVLVTSYQTLMADAEFLDVIPWRYIVIDEAHKLKNRETKLLQSLQNFSWDSCLLMTGTPLQNGVYELWCLLNFIEPDKFPSQQQFYDEYGELSTAEQVARLHEQLRPYMLRRVKEDVEKSIPPKEETIIDVELTTMQKKYYRAIFERNRSFLNMGANTTVANLVNVEMELRKCCNHPFLIRGVEDKECGHADDAHRAKTLIQASGKTVLLDKLLTKFKAENKKVLIFSQFKIMLDIIEDLCQLRNDTIERMDGSVRGNSRQAAIDRFNNPASETFAFLLSTRAGGVGINLIAASVVILFDSDWNPQNDLQAVARCHRIGQTQSVNIYRLVTKKTYEAQMFDIASKKLGMHHAVFETGGVRNEFDGEDEGSGNMMSLMSLDREKVEMMIRYGAYAIMGGDHEDEDPENRAINEVDIDQLLSSSRTIRYDPTRGDNQDGEAGEGGAQGAEGGAGGAGAKPVSQSSALSFSKASFTAETSDATIDFNDDQFWEKVLGPKLVQVLMTKVQEGWLSKATKDDVKKFLTELRDLARNVVKERQRGGALEDADQVMSILIELKVTGPILKNVVNVRTVATEWLEVIERPKRRRNQDAESELMYLEFLDGTKHAPALAGKKKKKKSRTKNGAAAAAASAGGAGNASATSAANGRRTKAKANDRRREPSFDSEDGGEENDDDEGEEGKKPKRSNKRQSTGSGGSGAASKSGIHVVLRPAEKAEDGGNGGDDDGPGEYSFVRTYSTIKKIEKLLNSSEDPDADFHTPVKAGAADSDTPRRRGRPRKLSVGEEDENEDEDEEEEEEEDDEGDEPRAADANEAESEEGEEDEEDAAEDDGEEEDDDDDADEEEDDDDTPKKKKRKQKQVQKKQTTRKSASSGRNGSARKLSVDPQIDEEMWCRVCASDQGFMDDPIVQCERCNVAVHKYCYGIDKVPEGDTPWFCDFCGETETSSAEATCALCPLKRKTSAFKKTCEGDWVHVVCALWAPGVQFVDVERMQDVKNVPEVIAETRGEQCGICQDKDGCIKCFRGSCSTYFHPLCGRESKGQFDMFMNESGQLRAFCPKHRTRARR